MAYRKKSDKELEKEFIKLYRKIPTANELKQFRAYLDSFSIDAFIEKAMEAEAAKKHEYENNFKGPDTEQEEQQDDSV